MPVSLCLEPWWMPGDLGGPIKSSTEDCTRVCKGWSHHQKNPTTVHLQDLHSRTRVSLNEITCKTWEPIKRTNKQDPNINWFTDVYGKLKCSIVHQVPEWSNVKNHLALRVESQGAFTNALLRSSCFFSGVRGFHVGLYALVGFSHQAYNYISFTLT